MSTRQPAPKRRQAADSRRQEERETYSQTLRRFPAVCLVPTASCGLHFNINQILWIETFHEVHNLIMFELSIAGFDYQKETITRRQGKIGRVENRVIWLRQLIQGQHAKDRGQGGEQDRAFESDRNKRRPTVIRLAANIQWIVDNFHPVLHEKSG